jgi:hypothetical protein
MLRVRQVDPSTDPRWDRFAASHEQAVAYHLGGWSQILEEAYGFRPHYLAVEEAGELHGILPLAGRRRPISRSRMRSLPVVPCAGPISRSPQATGELLQAADRLAAEHGALLVIDSRAGDLGSLASGFERQARPPSWILELPAADRVDDWERERPTNLRRSIRKAAGSDLSVRLGRGPEDVRRFYRLYLSTMRGHNSLPRTLRQMLSAQRLFEPTGVFALFLVERDGSPVAGGLFHVFNGTAELLYNASHRPALELRPNHGLYRHVIGWAIERGLHRVDFGFAHAGSSLAAFKAQWGAEPVAEYRYVPSSAGAATTDLGTAIKGRAVGASLRGRVAEAWERTPLPVTRLAGEVAYRWL